MRTASDEFMEYYLTKEIDLVYEKIKAMKRKLNTYSVDDKLHHDEVSALYEDAISSLEDSKLALNRGQYSESEKLMWFANKLNFKVLSIIN